MNGEEFVTHPRVTDDPREAGPQDYVIISLKAHSVPPVVAQMLPLLGRETAVVTASTASPGGTSTAPGPWENHRLEAVDPGGKQWDLLGPERAIGCVLWPAAEVVEPGVVQHEYGERFSLGEPDGSRSERVERWQSANAAGLKAPVSPRLRNEIWMKLWGNLSFNPVCVLTLATLEAIAADPGCCRVSAR